MVQLPVLQPAGSASEAQGHAGRQIESTADGIVFLFIVFCLVGVGGVKKGVGPLQQKSERAENRKTHPGLKGAFPKRKIGSVLFCGCCMWTIRRAVGTREPQTQKSHPLLEETPETNRRPQLGSLFLFGE